MSSTLREAAELYRDGDRQQAAKLLKHLVKQEPNNAKAWYGLALCVEDVDQKIYCLEKVIRLDPSHGKSHHLLEELKSRTPQSTLESQPEASRHLADQSQETESGSFINNLIDELSTINRNILLAVIGILVLLAIYFPIGGIARHTQEKNAQATATAEYSQCTAQFENEMVRLLSQFFRQQDIAEVTARVNLPEQISRLEDIRTEAWNMPEKSCQPEMHSHLMDYMDQSIVSLIAFSAETDWLEKYLDSLDALAELDDMVVRVYDSGGLVSLFRSKGYFYWEGLDDPMWKDDLDA